MLKPSNMEDALADAKVVGHKSNGSLCVWYGGYSFNVYDAVGEWEEIEHFTSGQLAGIEDYDSPEAYGYAKARMRSEGFTVIE